MIAVAERCVCWWHWHRPVVAVSIARFFHRKWCTTSTPRQNSQPILPRSLSTDMASCPFASALQRSAFDRFLDWSESNGHPFADHLRPIVDVHRHFNGGGDGAGQFRWRAAAGLPSLRPASFHPPETKSYGTRLHHAVMRDDADGIDACVRLGVPIDSLNDQGYSALGLAVKFGRVRAAASLVKRHGADVAAGIWRWNPAGVTTVPAIILCDVLIQALDTRPFASIVKLPDDTLVRTVLCGRRCTSKSSARDAGVALSSCAAVAAGAGSQPLQPSSPLNRHHQPTQVRRQVQQAYAMLAAYIGDDAALVASLHGSHAPCQPPQNGLQPAKRSDGRRSLDVAECDVVKDACFLCAVLGGHVDMARKLRPKSISLSTTAIGSSLGENGHLGPTSGRIHATVHSTLAAAASSGSMPMLRWVLEDCNVQFGSLVSSAARPGGQSTIAMMSRAAGCGSVDMLEHLWSIGIRPDPRCADYAAWNGHVHVLQWLMDHGCAPENRYPLQQALSQGHGCAAEWIIRHMVSEIPTAMHPALAEAAASSGDVDVVKWAVDTHGWTPNVDALLAAARTGNVRLLHWMAPVPPRQDHRHHHAGIGTVSSVDVDRDAPTRSSDLRIEVTSRILVRIIKAASVSGDTRVLQWAWDVHQSACEKHEAVTATLQAASDNGEDSVAAAPPQPQDPRRLITYAVPKAALAGQSASVQWLVEHGFWWGGWSDAAHNVADTMLCAMRSGVMPLVQWLWFKDEVRSACCDWAARDSPQHHPRGFSICKELEDRSRLHPGSINPEVHSWMMLHGCPCSFGGDGLKMLT